MSIVCNSLGADTHAYRIPGQKQFQETRCMPNLIKFIMKANYGLLVICTIHTYIHRVAVGKVFHIFSVAVISL